MTQTCRLAAVAFLLALSGTAKGGPITDPTGDFLPTYTGARNGAFDVVSASGTFNGKTFHLSATLAGPVSGAPTGSTPLYVWGINTGTGPGNFANVGNPDVRFNAVFTLNAAGGTNNAAVIGSINGNVISIDVPVTLPNLASTGFAPENYLWNLWPRDVSAPSAPAPIGNAAAISDFAPDNAVAPFALVPEPSTLVLFTGMLGALGVVARRRRSAAA